MSNGTNIGNIIRLELKSEDEDDNIIHQSREIVKGMEWISFRDFKTLEAMMKSQMNVQREPSSEIAMPFGSNSICPLLFNETDFEWGKPEWVRSDFIPVPSYVWFFNNKDGKSIGVYVTLKEDMLDFEKDIELLAYTAMIST